MKAILFGTGWRAMFYVRIAATLPGLLSIDAVYTRHQERLALISAMGLCAAHDMDEALSHEHDIVIVASGKGSIPLPFTRLVLVRTLYELSCIAFPTASRALHTISHALCCDSSEPSQLRYSFWKYLHLTKPSGSLCT